MNHTHQLLVATVVVALWLTGASAATAGYEFHSEASSTTFTGSLIGIDHWTLDEEKGCESITYKGSQAGSTATTIFLAPTYSQCAGPFAGATVDMNGCEYRFHVTAQTTGTTYDGDTDIVCPSGKEMTITTSLFGTSKCTVHIPPQENMSNIEFHNLGSGTTRDIKLTFNISKLHYTETAGTGFGACSGGTDTNGIYTGEATLTGEEGSTHRGIWIA